MWRSSPVPSSSSSRSAAGQVAPGDRRCRSRSPRRPPRAAAGGRSTPPSTHGSSAPSEIDSVGSGTISSGSITRWKPSPWQRGQQPCGELKEKIRGSSSGIEVPQLRQANFSRSSSGACSPQPAPAPSPLGDRSESTSSISMRPSASCDAASSDSARRLRSPSFITRRSTTIEMSCLNFLSSSIVLVEAAQLAVDRRRGHSPARASPRAASRTRPCARGRPAPGP